MIQTYREVLVGVIETNREIFPGDENKAISEAIKSLGEDNMIRGASKKYIFQVNFKADNSTFKLLLDRILEECKNIQIITKSSSDFPFLVLFDEADLLNSFIKPGRIPGVNIVRRALHLLNATTSLMTLAIGTNSDALDFSPAVRDDSLRIITKKNLLPPFILSGNWDIFFNSIEFNQFEPDRETLLSFSMFNLLVSMGRPLWSSCSLGEIISTAVVKLKNGDFDSIGALVAPLLVRASIEVNVNHVFARNLIKSYMIIVNYVSTNATTLKIGYSSEPVLAMAARNLLKLEASRENSFRALKKLLEDKAIDKGRIVEFIFEHLTLFAVDDVKIIHPFPIAQQQIHKVIQDLRLPTNKDEKEPAEMEIEQELKNIDTNLEVSIERKNEQELGNTETTSDEYLNFTSNVPEFVPAEIKEIMENTSFLLNRKKNAQTAKVDLNPERLENYRIVTIKQIFSNLLGSEVFKNHVEPVIHSSILRGLANISHYVQMEHADKNYFEGLVEDEIMFSKLLKKLLDRSMLKCGIIRSMGIVMPPNYFGIDFLFPFLIDDSKKKFRRPLYSFIAFQSKTSKTSTTDCAYRMAAILHLIRCPHSDHFSPEDCQKVDCKSYFTQDEIDEICANQVVVLLAFKNDEAQRILRKTVAVKDFPTIVSSKAGLKQKEVLDMNEKLKENILNHCESHYADFIKKEEKNTFKAVSYPTFKGAAEYMKPDFIMTNVATSFLTVQKMVWNVGPPDEKQETFKCKRVKTEPIKENILMTTKRRTLTCIDIHDIRSFNHFLSKNTIAVMLEIINLSSSNFHNVEPIHKPIVQNSMLSGKFCPYHAFNPMLNLMRNLPKIKNPIENYSTNTFMGKLPSAFEACAKGPIRANLEPKDLSNNYHVDKFKEVEAEIEAERNESDNEI